MRAPPNDWDTPADGDFARYVERLSAAQALHPAAPAHLQGNVPTAPAAAVASAPVPARAPAPVPAPSSPGAVQGVSATGVAGLLRAVRVVLLLLVIAQAVALFYFNVGLMPLMLFSAGLWFFLGRLQRVLSRALSGAAGGDSTHLQRLREQLPSAARKRATSAKK